MRIRLTATFAILALAACSAPEAQEPVAEQDIAAIEHEAHGAFVDAINSNDTKAVMEVLTDDVVFQYPGAPELVGKEAVRPWIQGYYDAFDTEWEKTSHGFTVDGDTAYQRYTYRVTDTAKDGGAVTTDVGKGVTVFRRGDDGKWRVAIDGWSSDTAPGQAEG